MKLRVALCGLAAVVAACELQEISLAEPDDIVIVEAILRADESVQKLLIHRSVGLGPPPGADVRVTDSGGIDYRFHPASDSLCLLAADSIGAGASSCYAWTADPGRSFVRPGGRYSLRVATTDGRVLTGTTRVPGAFAMVDPPVAACELPADTTFELVWTSSQDAWVYIAETSLHNLREALRARGIAVPNDPLRLVGLSVARADTTILFPAEFGLFDRFDDDLSDVLVALQRGLPPDVVADIVIGAADRNYVNWVRGGSFNPSGSVRVPSVHGVGGTGVFGSVATLERTLATAPAGNRPPC